MILFVSGRCDIPAFYSSWFFQRMKEGFVDVRNPFNPHQISRIPLDPHHIDAILFCTKNPLPMMDRLDEVKDIPYIFHITITPYHADIEKNVPDKHKIVEAIKRLSKKLGSHRVVLRYDPILISKKYTKEYHFVAFEKLAKELTGHIDTCIISFVDEYKNTKKNMDVMKLYPMREIDMQELAYGIGTIGKKYNLDIQTCAEDIDLTKYHIQKGACVSQELMSRLLGHPYEPPGGNPVRNCQCLPTVDIGDYNCCSHQCLYCYANYDEDQVFLRMREHDPYSSVLLGHVNKDDTITVRKEKEYRQITLL